MAVEADRATDPADTELRLWFGDHVDADEVRLGIDFDLGADLRFRRSGDGWALAVPRPDIQRLEYKIEVNRHGDWAHVTDPLNVRTVPNPFGDKSELLFADYREPVWLARPPSGSTRTFPTPARPLGTAIPATLWSPDGLADSDPAPLLLVHDGSDFAERGSLLRWATQSPRPARLLLLDPVPGRRDDWYAANDDYADQLAVGVLPLVHDMLSSTAIFGWGASLGALAMLHLHRRHPSVLDGLILQSGSFFTRELDSQESGYGMFHRVVQAVAEVRSGSDDGADPIPVLMTCGRVEENRFNNERMAAVLSDCGYPVELRLVRDAHTMVGWRDAWSPAVEGFVDRVCDRPGPAAPGGTQRS